MSEVNGPRGGEFLRPFSYKAVGTTEPFEPLDERRLGLDQQAFGIETSGVFKSTPTPQEVDRAWTAIHALDKRRVADKKAQRMAKSYRAMRTRTLESFAKFDVSESEIPPSIVEVMVSVILESDDKNGLLKRLRGMVDVKMARRAFDPEQVAAASEKLTVGVSAIHDALESSTQNWKLSSISQGRFLDDGARAYAEAIGKQIGGGDSSGGSGGAGNGGMSRHELNARYPGLHRFRVALDPTALGLQGTMPLLMSARLAAKLI